MLLVTLTRIYAMDRAQPFLWPLLFGPEYTLATRLSLPGCFNESIDAIWGSIDDVDFLSQIPKIEVPVFFFTGRHDWNTPYPLVEEWAEVLNRGPVEVYLWRPEDMDLIGQIMVPGYSQNGIPRRE